MSKAEMFRMLEEVERDGHEFMAFTIQTPVNLEVIMVRSEFAAKKCQYIADNYDDNMVMKHNKFIYILNISIGDKGFIMNDMDNILPRTEEEDEEY